MERIRIEETVPLSEKDASKLLRSFLKSRPETNDLSESGDFNALVTLKSVEGAFTAALPASTYVQLSFIQSAVESHCAIKAAHSQTKVALSVQDTKTDKSKTEGKKKKPKKLSSKKASAVERSPAKKPRKKRKLSVKVKSEFNGAKKVKVKEKRIKVKTEKGVKLQKSEKTAKKSKKGKKSKGDTLSLLRKGKN